MNKRVVSAVLLGVILLAFGGTSADAQRRRGRANKPAKLTCPTGTTAVNLQEGDIVTKQVWIGRNQINQDWFTMPANMLICRE